MANRIKVAEQNDICALWRLGWSQRRIARELGLNRETVSRYVRAAESIQNQPNPIPGTGESEPANVTSGTDSKPANPIPGSWGPSSRCDPFRQAILEMVESDLSGQRIYQDLVSHHSFTASYSSVRRFLQKLGRTRPLPFRRIETPPGEQAQIDFGRGAPIEVDGRRRWPHVFRIVLSYSRKAYSEAVWQESTESFIRCLENAFAHFGGVPRTLVTDNLKAAVIHADWYDPELNPKLQAFCRHYGTIVLPTKPAMPRHKGKIESAIKYVRNNGLKGHQFKNLAEENTHLSHWESQVADHRIHGTTRKQVSKLFQQERTSLLPLPSDRFPFFHEAQRAVHRDAHIEIEKAYYSVPPEYVGRMLWVRWDSRLVRVYNARFEQIALHVKSEAGRFNTQQQHLCSEKISSVERGAGFLLKRATLIGPQTSQWAQAMLSERGIQGLRVLQGLLSLTRKHSSDAVEKACELALSHGSYRLKPLRRLIEHQSRQQQLDFIEDHPLIRQLSVYGRIVRVSLQETQDHYAPKPGRVPPPEEARPPLRSSFLEENV
jgi:transposase